MVDMIETLAEIDLPRRWVKPDSDSTAMKQWPLLATLVNGSTDELTEGVIMGLKVILDYLQLATDLDPEDLPLPTTETLEKVLQSKEKLIPALVDQFETLESRQKESKTSFTNGLFIGFACWFLCVKDIGDAQKEEAATDVLYNDLAYSVESAEEPVNADKNPEETGTPQDEVKVARFRSVRDVVHRLQDAFGVTCEIVLRNNQFVLVTAIAQAQLCYELLQSIETMASLDGSVVHYVITEGRITAAVAIPSDMEW